MNAFTIDNETNEVTLHAAPEAGEMVSNAERFNTAEELLALSEKWPTSRLIQIWNILPGTAPVKKFADRKTAVSRIWKALQALEPPFKAKTVAPVEECPPSDRPGSEAGQVEHDASVETRATVDELAPDVASAEDTPGKKATRSKRAHTGEAKAKTTRDGSKTATVVDLMKREGGVTLKTIMEKTGWQAHSVRGFISGTLTKKLGLAVNSAKGENGERTYTIAS